ncbi:hypothetical protein ABL78_5558 [Leptomonas seymouri]|uniref:Uncharacterized protein n=1 Tax=Leptomonas seymouri TaxID=5684 RepID=A0A0N0P4Y7_LEPSE|nr:hypothetical protein ABL78_5558 [Leptomonas seymouri]|eukprot:KPI85377.1 hypothetical protein ABL78_5558 [Leptomonas seymouri]
MFSFQKHDSLDDVEVASAASYKPKRRRVVNCTGPSEDVLIEIYYADDARNGETLRYTSCMLHHIMARIEGDVFRAKMREENPISAIPSKGEDYDMAAVRVVEEYYTTHKLPQNAEVLTSTLVTLPHSNVTLPAIWPRARRSRSSNCISSANTPLKQCGRGGSRMSIDPNALFSRSPSRGPSRSPSQIPQNPCINRPQSVLCSVNGSADINGVPSCAEAPPRASACGRLPMLAHPSPPPTIAKHRGGFRDDGRAAGAAAYMSPQKSSKGLYLEPSSFEDDVVVTSDDLERQRRLWRAEELARQMDAEVM